MVKDFINGEETDYFQVTAVNEENIPEVPTIAEDKLKKLRGDKANEEFLLYRPLLKHNDFEKQGGIIFHSQLSELLRLYNLLD